MTQDQAVHVPVPAAQDALRAITAAEDALGRYEAHLRRVASVTKDQESLDRVEAVREAFDDLVDARLVLWDAVTAHTMREREAGNTPRTFLRTDDDPS